MAGDFDAQEFVKRCREDGTSLSTISEGMNKYIKKIKTHLITHVNKDYEKFVTLSTGLDNFDSTLGTQRELLEDLEARVGKMRDVISNTLRDFREKMSERRDLKAQQHVLEIFTNTIHSLELVENLLQQTPSSSNNKTSLPLEEMHVERIAQEYSRLAQYMWQGREWPFIDSLKPRVDRARRELIDRLEVRFAGEIIPDDPTSSLSNKENNNTITSSSSYTPALEHVLRSFDTIGCSKDAERSFSELVVCPLVNNMFTRGRIDRGGPRGKCVGLSSLYDELEDFVKIQCRPLLSCANKFKSFDFVGNSVWSSLIDRLVEMDSDIFSVGDPDVFHSNLTRSVKFVNRLDEIAKHCSSSNKSLWQHPRTRDYFERWNCEVYFQLRRQEILSSLDNILEKKIGYDGPSRPISTPDTTSLKFSDAVWNAIDKCWSANVFLSVLTDRFLILSLQILGRYIEWLCEISRSKDAKISVFVHALHDCEILRARVIQKKFPDRECVETFQEISFDRARTKLFESLISNISSSCESGLRAVSSIAASFRMSSKPMPTQHSNFVPSILRPLNHFVRIWGKGNYVESDLMGRLVESVSLRVMAKYQAVSAEMMDSVRKTEESLSRLRRLRTSDKKNSSTSNEDSTFKIRRQLHLDLDFFTEQLSLLLNEDYISKQTRGRVLDTVKKLRAGI